MLNNIKIIGIDLDGTLFDDYKEISLYTKKVLDRAASKGILIVPVTGRPLSGIPKSITDLPFISYIITSNGSLIYKFDNSFKKISESLIDNMSVLKLVTHLRKYDVIIEIFTEGKGYLNTDSLNSLLSMYKNSPVFDYLSSSRTGVSDVYEFFRINKLQAENISVICKNTDQREIMVNELNTLGSFNFVYTTETGFEIGAENADKGTALKYLCSLLKILPTQVAAFGDSANDIGMLNFAEESFAMEFSSKEVINASKHVAPSNNNDGVAKAIESYFL